MKHWPIILAILAIMPVYALSNVAKFEGKIKILKEGIYDTLQFEISVKNDVVRIDELSARREVLRTYLINLSEERVFVLSLKDKLYKEVSLRESTLQNHDIEVIKTQNSMAIDGVVCYQWRVRNKRMNSEVTYWVAQQEFSFLRSLVNILGRTQTPLEILGYFPQESGYFPLVSVDRTLLRKVKVSARIVDIKAAKLPEALFIIPPDFREFLG